MPAELSWYDWLVTDGFQLKPDHTRDGTVQDFSGLLVACNIQPIDRLWTEDICSFSNRPAHGPRKNWQTCLVCLLRQTVCWAYFAFCGTWLV